MESDFFQIYFSFTICVLTMICNLCKKKNDHDDNQLCVKARESGLAMRGDFVLCIPFASFSVSRKGMLK